MATDRTDPDPRRSDDAAEELQRKLDELMARQVEILESEARFRILSELISDCCWARWTSAGGDEERLWVNDAFESLTGYTSEEFETIGREGLVHPDDLELANQRVEGPVGPSDLEFRILRKDGEVRWLQERMYVRDDETGRLILGATRDVTAERLATETLRNIHRELEEQVARRTSELATEVQERRRVARELRRAKDQAEAASRAKSEFLANISHELRTPVNAILGLSGLLLSEDLPRRAAGYVGLLHETAETLQQLIREVLDFSKVEAGQITLEDHPFDPGILEQTLSSLLYDRAREQGTRLEISLARALPPRLRGDPVRLRQVLLNLAENALKFTHRGTVEVRAAAPEPFAEDDRVRVRFEVRDDGLGIPAHFRERLFEPFVQASDAPDRPDSGAGLGLSICKQLVELMGGTIELESTPRVGTVVRFSALLGRVGQERDTSSSAIVEGLPSRGLHQPWRVLLAEDHPVNRMVLRHQVELLGCSVVEVEDGAAAVRAATLEPFDLILMDCRMPGLDGYQATRAIRHTEGPGQHVPVIAVTASAVKDQIEACYDAGMDDVLTKPYTEESLAAVLRRWLSIPDP